MQLETERLLLRRPQPSDLSAYSELFSDPEVVRYTGGVRKTRSESELALQRMIRHWEDFEIGLFSVIRKGDDRVLGRVGFLLWDAECWQHAMLRPPRGETETEIGWTLARAHWGRGYATEGAAAIRAWAFESRSVGSLVSLITPGNIRSQRVAQRLGAAPGDTITPVDSGRRAVVWHHPAA